MTRVFRMTAKVTLPKKRAYSSVSLQFLKSDDGGSSEALTDLHV